MVKSAVSAPPVFVKVQVLPPPLAVAVTVSASVCASLGEAVFAEVKEQVNLFSRVSSRAVALTLALSLAAI